jgi:DNA polymerase-4
MHSIVFVRCPQFYVTAERSVGTPVDSPVAIIKDGIVIDASSEAEALGVRPGISRRLACQRCPSLQCVLYNPDHYKTCFHKVWSVFAEFTPLVEPIDLDERYIDLTVSMPEAKRSKT